MNKCIFIGRMCSDADLKQTLNGFDVCSFKIAVRRDKDNVDFIPCVAWRQTALFVSRWFPKGRMIAIEGRLQSRSYEDKDGKKRTALEVNVDQVHFCGDKETKEESFVIEADENDLPY